jgi:hypothetical protein
VHSQRAYVGGGLQPGAALVVVCLLRSRAVAGVSMNVCVCLGPVLASHATSLPAAAAADWRGRGQVHIAGWSGGVGSVRGLRGGGRRGWCEEWARRDGLKERARERVEVYEGYEVKNKS